MGIVDELLAEFDHETLGHCRIEADVNGTVHLHLGTLRIELSAREFRQFVAVIEQAQARLHELKDLEETDPSELEDPVAIDAV